MCMSGLLCTYKKRNSRIRQHECYVSYLYKQNKGMSMPEIFMKLCSSGDILFQGIHKKCCESF